MADDPRKSVRPEVRRFAILDVQARAMRQLRFEVIARDIGQQRLFYDVQPEQMHRDC